MIHSHRTTVLLFHAPIVSSLVQSLSAGIIGCSDVDCSNEGWDSCTVAGETYAGVGLSRITDDPGSLEGVSLVKGVHIEDPESDCDRGNGAEESRLFRSVYFLGTPTDLDINSLSGCAVVEDDPPRTAGRFCPTMGNYTNERSLAEMYKITPILTVFTSSNNTNSLVNDTTSSLTCLKVVISQNTGNATDTGTDAAAFTTANMLGVSLAALATVMFVLF